MKVQKGEKITVDGQKAVITKVSAQGGGVLNKETGTIRPTYRIYYKMGSKQGHTDAVLDDEKIEVVCG